jgi:predicted O-methyltransferase YrrM
MKFRTNWRRLKLGMQTVLGLKKRGFFIPYRYAATVPDTQPVYTHLQRMFAAKRGSFAKFCKSLDAYADDFSTFGPPPAPRWQQGWFSRLDGAAAYGIVRTHKPQTIIEVGSGHSTRFMARAIRDGGFECNQIAIDPAPRTAIRALPVTWHKELLNEHHMRLFARLRPDDIAFFDSSHILMPGTDVDIILNRILPLLQPGVLIHFHDIFLPDPYPASWLWRGYNEQNALGGVIATGGYEVVFSSAYTVSRMAEPITGSKLSCIPLFPGAFEASLWLKKTG